MGESNIFSDKVNQLSVAFGDLPVDDFDNDQLIEAETNVRALLKRRKAKTKRDARKLISACAGLFLDMEMLEKDEYAAYKIKIDTMSLSNTLLQLHTTHIAIEELCVAIVTGSANGKHYENLSHLQRIVLDINKFLVTYMTDMELSYRELRDRIIEMSIEKQIDDPSISKSDSSIVITTRDKQMLIDELNIVMDETKELMAIPSLNVHLSKDYDDAELADSVDRMMNDTGTKGGGEEEISSDDPYETVEGY